ncbi:MAG: DUF2269 domain-containing protein [Chloroflexi bacterium]|nr:DUF2269 domain-containing protein [Chloroflexota bacterium]
MILHTSARKFVLAVHLTTSVAWLGAVAAYVPLDLTVATSSDPTTVRGAWTAMGLIATSILVPLALASLITGILISVGTRWGLIRHWWVVVSLVLTVLAVTVLMVERGVITASAAIATAAATMPEQLLALPPTLPHSIGGLAILLVVQWLNVYKPQGLTPYGWRRQEEERARLQARSWARIVATAETDET